MKNKKIEYEIDKIKLAKNIRKAQSGNSKAFESIIKETQDFIYYYCLSLLKSEDDAAEAVQDIYIIIFKRLNSIKNPDAFLGWLKVVSSNYCKNKLIRKNNTMTLDDGYMYPDDTCPQLNPEKNIETDELCALINEAVSKLPDFQRECILMHYYYQMSISQIAAALGIKEGTVKSRLFNARKSLKAKLETDNNIDLLLDGVSPLAYLTYSLINNPYSKHTNLNIDLNAAVVDSAVDSSSILTYAVSIIPTTAKTFTGLKIAAILAAATAVGGGVITYNIQKINNTPDTSIVSQTCDTTKIKSEGKIESGSLSQNEAISSAISGINYMIETEAYVKGINEITYYISNDNITNNINFKKLPVNARYIKDDNIWVVVFTNGHSDVTLQMTDEISLDNISPYAIEQSHVWQDKNGTVFAHMDYEVYYYITEIDATTGKLNNYRCFYSYNNEGELEEQGGETIDEFLKEKYNTTFDVKYEPEK